MSRRHHLERLRQSAPAVLPSLLLCDFGNLEREVSRLREAGVSALHLDVMDGRFVPNLTYGMPIVEGLRRLTDMTLDVHLMIEAPERFLGAFVEAGADVITIHAEAVDGPRAVLQAIRDLGACSGLAVNPDTPLEALEECLDVCDVALVMSVRAGFGGQTFNPVALERIRRLRELRRDVLLEIDGGVNVDTIGPAAGAGADLMVVGTAIFRSPCYRQAVAELSSLASAAAPPAAQ